MSDTTRNVLCPTAHGPLQATGDLIIVTPDGDVVFEGEEAWLCRCGHSQTKPVCDGSHEAHGFDDSGALLKAPPVAAEPTTGRLTITLRPDGPLTLAGPYHITSPDGDEAPCAVKGSLCRCGLSETKPMCDGTHKQGGFKA